MRNFKSVLALVLVLAMLLGCMGNAFAAQKTKTTEIAKTAKTEVASDKSAKEEALQGFKSEEFKLNTYKYADDEIVRAIVILEGDCEADVAEAGSQKAANQRVKLINEHNAVRKEMKGISYELKHEFTTLLNGFSCDVAYGDLEAIASIEGVKSVHIANSYAAPELKAAKETKMENANVMTGNYFANYYGYDGAGITVAILDTGLNTTHEAFQDSLGLSAEYGVLTEEAVAAIETKAEGVYLNAKVPFAYDYADLDADVTDNNGHGTHVSGTVAGYVGEATEDGGIEYSFVGGSPYAQLLSMKIFKDEGGGTTSDIYFDALEDAYLLGADVVNMSIGAQNGFTYDDSLETEIYGNIYQRMADAGIVMSVAAGNEYSMAYYSTIYAGYTGCVGPDYTDYGTIASPSTYEGNLSVASVENTAYPAQVVQVGEANLMYVDSATAEEDMWLTTFGDTTAEYVIVTREVAVVNEDGNTVTDEDGNPVMETVISLGAAEDYEGIDVTGKIAVVSRGEYTFEEKVEFAANAGAIGCIVVNNAEGMISMAIETFEIPAISLEMSALEVLMNAETKEIASPSLPVMMENANAWLMSDFSNWGTSPMLTLDPTMTSVGGNIYSTVIGADDAYEVYSGTSMAAPNSSATYANVLAMIYEENPEISKYEAAELAKSLMLSYAYILTDADGYPYSPRKQGAGLAVSDYAIFGYQESAYIVDPIKELGDDPEKTGVYDFSVTINNDTEYDVYYGDLSASVLYDYIYTDSYGDLVNTLTSDYVDCNAIFTVGGTEITEFTLAAGESIDIDVSILLTEAMKAELDEVFENGTFIEGFVTFTEYYGEEAWSEIHATFLAYYGDWTQAPVLEEADFMDIIDANLWLNSTVADAEGNTYADYGYTYANSGLINFYTQPKTAYITDADITTAYAYAGDNMLDYIDYYPEHIAFSTPDTDGTYNYAEAIYMEPYQLRNLEHLIMTVSDKETGEVYYVDDTEYLPKSYYDGDYAAWMAMGAFYWDGKDAEGNYVPSGTVATITYDAVLPYGSTEIKDVWSFDVTVDYTAPTLDEIVLDEETMTLTVTATDENYLQAIYLADEGYNIVAAETFSSDEKGASFTAQFDISGMTAAYVIAMDYATNEYETYEYFFETGADAVINLVSPYGTETIACKTGDTFEFPAAPAIESHEFMFWAGEKVDQASEEEVWYVAEPWFFEGDSMLVMDTEYTLYSLYALIEEVELDKANYYMDYADDYSGDWAICGWNIDADYYWVTEDPMALDCNGNTTQVSALEDAEMGTEYIEFYTNAQDIRYTFEAVGENIYTIKSASNGKYLATNDAFEIVFVDEVTEYAKWYVVDAGTGYSAIMYNEGNYTAVLVYDDEAQQFAIYDDSIPYYGEYYPSEWFSTILYRCTDVAEEVVYYTFGKVDQAVIYYTNDIHTYIDNDLSYDTVAALKSETEKCAADVLLVDAGDHAQGTAYGSMDKGQTIIDLMNAAGYDYATLGNHEFDYGMDGAMSFIDKANFEYLSCNFYHEAEGVRGENVLSSYKVIELENMDGMKIALVGITTPESFTKSTPAYFQDENGNYIYGISGGIDGADLYADVQAAIDAAKAEGAELVIALGHLGDDPASDPWNSEDVIQNTTGLNAFIDGHSHSTVESKEVADKDGNTVILTQTGEYFNAIGKMTIQKDGTIATELLTSAVESDETVAAAVEAWKTEVDGLLEEVVAKNEVDFRIKDDEGTRLIRSQETNLGDFTADALYYLFDNMGMDVDVAIMNGGGIRADMPVGDISYKTTKTVHTFGNVACLQTITGQQLLDALEWGARNVGVGENGGFLQVSGITYEIHSYIESTVQADDKGVWIGAPTGEYRVKNVMVAGEALDLEATYNLAGYNYTLRDLGDGFAMFDGAVNVLDYVMEDYLVLANYAASFPTDGDLPTIKADNSVLGANYGDINGEGRIEIIAEEPTEEPSEEPSEEPTEPSEEPTVPSEEPTVPSEEPTEPSEEPTVPSEEPTEPSEEPTEPSETPCEHQFDNGTVTTAATCTAEGVMTYTCTLCGETSTENIAKLACSCGSFSDLSASEWYHNAVDFMVNSGYMNGVGDNKFAPGNTLTRAMVVTVLYRAAGSPAVSAPSTFTDVKAGEWYSDAIAWAQANDVVKGMSATTFEPMTAVTREQIATILYRYAGAEKVDADMTGFGDAAKISAWASEAMSWAVSEGIFSGDQNRNLNPTDNATRAEFATIIYRYLQ
ncbi:MAG: hypothetical protein E7434_03365 [Ruminococcaceae bacterium]|nr:hypothetical protein [Oscillospiraceae bacterium]